MEFEVGEKYIRSDLPVGSTYEGVPGEPYLEWEIIGKADEGVTIKRVGFDDVRGPLYRRVERRLASLPKSADDLKDDLKAKYPEAF